MMKCLAVGMSSEFIRKEYQNKKLRTLMKFNNQEIALFRPRITPLDLLSNDRSSLTTFEWRLLSNVTHAFDKSSVVSTIQNIILRGLI